MSGPFSIFRKNQRVWMAMLVALAMVSFIILPIFNDFGQNYGSVDRATAVRWKNGSISHVELRTLAESYRRSYQFLDRLAQEVVQLGGRPGVPGYSQDGSRPSLGLQEPDSAQSVAQTMLLAEEARRHGVYIDDQTVDLYIRELTNGRITESRFNELMRETVGPDLNRFQLYRFIKDEICKQLLLQMQAASLAYNGAPLVTPSTNWENFRKFEQRAKIEAYPISTSSYLDKVQGTPTERELLAIYEEGKDRFPNKEENPLFGFARRYSADFEYVRGYMDKFLDAEKKTITEEQIKAEYDRRVAAGQFQVEDKTGSLEPTTPATAAPPAEVTNPAPAEGDSSKTETPAETPKTEATPAETAPSAPVAPEAPKAEGSEPAPAEPKTNESGKAVRPNPLRLVAFQDEANSAEKKPEEPAAPETKAPESQPSETAAPAPAASTESAPAAPPAAGTAPATETKPPMRTKSLDEVREEIIQSLAYTPAQLKLQQALQGALQKMEKFQQEEQYYNDAQRTGFDKNVVKPKPLDLAKIADEFGLEYGRTGMLDAISSRQTDLGKSFFQTQRSFSPPQFSQLMFDKQIPLYVPYNFDSFGLNASLSSFVTWKVEQKDGYVPTFEQAREEVVAAWKESKARELAQAYALELAAKLTGQPDWSAALSATDQAIIQKPSPFTWLQQPSFMSQASLLTRIDGIGYVDDQFMKDAFNNKLDTYSVAPSINKDRYFVIKTIGRLPDDSEVLKKFSANSLSPATQTLATAQLQNLQAAYFNHYREELQLDMSGLERTE